MQIHLANPRGFCAGVDRAITIVERALEMFAPPIYVRHEVVHNKFVVDGLASAWCSVLLTNSLKCLMTVLSIFFGPWCFSGSSKLKLQAVDSKCLMRPVHWVTKVHMEVMRAK